MRTVEEQNRVTANELLNSCVSLARLVLRKYGEFGPFGFSVDIEEQVARETLDRPRLPSEPEALMRLLEEHMATRARRGEVVSVATAANVTLREPTSDGNADAIAIHIEHRNGYCVEAVLPYRLIGGQLWGILPRRVALEQMRISDGTMRIFQH